MPLSRKQTEIPPPITEDYGSLPCSQQSTTGPYPEPDESSPHIPTLFLQDPF
jgi:hypothetical protein